MDATDVATGCSLSVAGPTTPTDRRMTMRRRFTGRSTIGMFIAGLTAGAGLILSPAMVSAAPCDGPSCVEHLRTDAVGGAECPAARLYAFGLDANGNTYICYATYRNPTTSTWVPVPGIVGVRDFGALCGGGVAQTLDGIPMVCRDGIWARYTPALSVE